MAVRSCPQLSQCMMMNSETNGLGAFEFFYQTKRHEERRIDRRQTTCSTAYTVSEAGIFAFYDTVKSVITLEQSADGPLTARLVISPNSTWLVTSRLDTTRHVRRIERVETSVSSRAFSTWRTTNKL